MAQPPTIPLVIETGAGVSGANSYITAAELDAYALAYFDHAETGSNSSKEAALRRAWLYLKSLPWKSDYPFPTLSGTIPADVKLAQGVLAHYEKLSPGGLQPNVVPGQQKVLTRVGEIGWQVMGQTGVDAQRAVVTMADDLLKPYLQAKTNFLLRA
jgi:hypothetical protein